ncbi:MAG: hypothetical protein HPY45_04460 [Anaerolineae bacterium]|nr:hypothetical protein [Anaerolineae bacterium]
MMNSKQMAMGEGGGLWLLKAFSGALLVIILAIHLVVNHLVYESGVMSWQDVVIYYQNPIIVILEAVFLVSVVAHALLGLRGILLDLQPSNAILVWINRLSLAIGIVAVLYGLWLLLTVASFG